MKKFKPISLFGFIFSCCVLCIGCAPRDDAPESNSTAKSKRHEQLSDSDRYKTFEVAELTDGASTPINVDPLDWLSWRGPEQNGNSRETGLIDDWDPKGGPGSNVAWKRDDLGGRSTPVVMDGRLYTIVRSEPGTKKEGEKVVCVDAKTGDTVWENAFNVYLSDVPDTRVGWSSVVGDPETGNVYSQGVCGHFQCMDARTGKTKWYIPLHERFGLLSTYGGRTNFPIICDDLVITSAVIIGWGEMAKPCHRFIAMDKRTGDVVWLNGTRPLPEDTTYGSPTLAVIDGQKVMVTGSGDGAVWAFQPRTGKPIWQYMLSRRGLNTPPLVDANRVFMGHSEENITGTTMGAIVSFNALGKGDITEPATNWRVDEVAAGRTQPLLIDGRIWVFTDQAKLLIFDAANGEAIGSRIALGAVMRSSPLYADGKVYAATENGRWYILVPDERNGAKILRKGRLPQGEEVHSSIIGSHGRVYIQTTGALYCLKDDNKEPGATEIPSPEKESPVADDPQPALLQIVPAEILTQPGKPQELQVRLFNSKGQFLKVVDNAQFELQGPGKIENGTFQVGAEGAHKATIITAKLGTLSGESRVRTVPPLPWAFDFENTPIDGVTHSGEPPITWVGCRYRHVIREVDGNKILVKITTIPKGTRSRCWMGPSDLHDYTMQADVKGALTENKLPDIGLLAQGYALDLQGESQKLEIRTWVTQRRMAKTIDFVWDSEKWYTMKFEAKNEENRVVLRGKVWPRGTDEPNGWTLEAVDDSPNVHGSPGLYGNAKTSEIYLDNISVVPNG